MGDHLNTNGLVDGNIPAGQSCPFVERCSARTTRCPVDNDTLPWPFSCAAARAHSIGLNPQPCTRAYVHDCRCLKCTAKPAHETRGWEPK